MSLAEEFQLIYVATAPSRRWEHKSPLKREQCLVTSLQAGQRAGSWRWAGQGGVTVEKAGQHHLGQVNISSDKPCDNYAS